MTEKDSSLALKVGAMHDLDMKLGIKVAQKILNRTIAQFGHGANISTAAYLFENETGARIGP